MFTEIKFHEIPRGTMTLYNPAFRTATLTDIELVIDFANEWQPFGYTKALFCRNTASVYVVREEAAGTATATVKQTTPIQTTLL